MTDLAQRWETAKKDFEKMTGKHKPKPKGTFAKMFNHTNISGTFKSCDKALLAIENENKDMAKKQKRIAEAKKLIPTIDKAAKSYIKQLDAAAKDEAADAGAKTTYSKALKFLRDRLDALDKLYDAKVSNEETAIDESLSSEQKFAKFLYKNLIATVANATSAIKKVKANPTPEQFNELFDTNDGPGRKVQVQLVQAAAMNKKGQIPDLIVDPRHIADKLTPWQAEGKGQCVLPADASEADVSKRIDEFRDIIKLAGRYLTDLQEKT